MASVRQTRGKKVLVEALLKSDIIEALRERNVETLGLSDEGVVYKVGRKGGHEGNCLTISVTAKSEFYDGERAVANYKDRIKNKITALKAELDFYENLGI